MFNEGMKKKDKNMWVIHKGVCIVKLTQGKHMVIDIEDMPILQKHIFHASKHLNTYYAKTADGKKKSYLHRLIMNPPKDKVIDHVNHNGLNNTRENLRIVTGRENNQNRTNNNKYGVRGLRLTCGGWYISIKNKNGTTMNRFFGIKKNGYEEGYELAKKWREEKEQLYGYI